MNVQQQLEETGAHLKGHFLLSSGLHSDQYFQCAKLLQHPDLAEKVGRSLADEFRSQAIDVIVAPALGGVILGHEVARSLGLRFIFGERCGDEGKLNFRRGFEIQSGEKSIIVEDVITTGGSVFELKELVESQGGSVVGFASIVDRTSNDVNLSPQWKSLTKVQVNTYSPSDCPLCAEGSQPIKPGSRKNQ